MPDRFLDYETLLRVPAVDVEHGFDISPDGQMAAFAWNKTGQWEIYLLDLDSPGNVRQISSEKGAKFGPRFSPDGRTLIYVLDMDGGERYDICLCHPESGEQINLTPDSPETIMPDLAWSPGGDKIAYISDRSGRFSTYIQAIDQDKSRLVDEAKLVFDGSGPNMSVEWSPDGERLAVTAEGDGQDYFSYIVPVGDRNKEQTAIPLMVEGAVLNAKQTCWSPDGKKLAFSSDLLGSYNIGIFETSTGMVNWLALGEGDQGNPDWSKDGRRMCFVHCEGPENWLAVLDLDSGKVEKYQIEPGLYFSPQFPPEGTSILTVFDNPRRPDDLWKFELSTKEFQQLTVSLPENLKPDDFVMPKHVFYPSLDGRRVPALLYEPEQEGTKNREKPPAVVVVHGGPTWLFSFLWYPIMAHLASRGWVVLAPNYRGSTGYGREWQLANRFELGRSDTMDVAAGVDYLLAEGLADPQRIAITGRSHGGYLTMTCLAFYPERWAAGSAVVPFLNWFTSHANSRKDLQHWDLENMGDPVNNEALWRERSPFFRLEEIQAPVQLICGANDPRCPASESIAARDALIRLGKEVDLLLYPDEGHTFLKVENVVEHELKRVEFLRRALEDDKGRSE